MTAPPSAGGPPPKPDQSPVSKRERLLRGSAHYLKDALISYVVVFILAAMYDPYFLWFARTPPWWAEMMYYIYYPLFKLLYAFW